MKDNKRNGTCLCGIRLALHYTIDNGKLSCEDTKKVHPTAKVSRVSLVTLLLSAGAQS